MDLDFLVTRDALPQVDEIMQRRGYRLRYRSENVSQFVSDSAPLGQVDFLHAFREISTGIAEPGLDVAGICRQPTRAHIRPDDIIGLKVQALSNDPRRERQDLADIELLTERYSREIDGSGYASTSRCLTDWSCTMRSEKPTAPLTDAEKAELLALAGSTELRMDMRSAVSNVRNRKISIDEYIAFATSVARLANHPRRPFRPPNESGFKL